MKSYYDFVKNYLEADECKNDKYCDIGKLFYVSNDTLEGFYWFYETENFIIDIHDCFVKKEFIYSNFSDINLSDMSKFMSICSSYIITANGECFNPYQSLYPNSLYVLDVENLDENYRYLLHSNSVYLGVSINFKKTMLDQCLASIKHEKNISNSDIFSHKNSFITKALEPIAKDILSCKMSSPAAELFFEAKAKEWISIVIDSYLNRKDFHISKDDNISLENVAKYLDDHYALDIPQETLEKISLMSGTKLKKLFKQKYQSSITEYTQRRRMNIAETLILNSSLKIQDISEAVGYSSHSKFSACFKKYKGIYPREMKKNFNKTATENK